VNAPRPSPLQEIYASLKAAQPAGTILLLKLGDFYEVFGDDAKTVSRLLEITLTQRQGVPMAGIPFHCLDRWTEKLTAAGHKVAVAEYQPRKS
jgi:DNA mismatch repair protein MutS